MAISASMWLRKALLQLWRRLNGMSKRISVIGENGERHENGGMNGVMAISAKIIG
jgi:hypothetical protein